MPPANKRAPFWIVGARPRRNAPGSSSQLLPTSYSNSPAMLVSGYQQRRITSSLLPLEANQRICRTPC